MDPLDPRTLLAVLAMIDPRRWGIRLQIVAMIGTDPEGQFASYRDVAGWCGTSSTYTRTVLEELVAARVLVSARGGGRRASAWMVNPAVASWEAVPWKVPTEVVVDRVWHLASRHYTGSAPVVPRRESAALRDLVPRRESAALGSVVPRCMDRGTTAPVDDLVPRSRTAALRDAFAPALERGTTTRTLKEEEIFSSLDCEPPPPCDVDPADVETVKRAILAHLGGGWIKGRPLRHLEELVARWGPDRLVELVPTAPSDAQVPKLIGYLSDAALVDPEGTASTERARIAARQRLAAVERHVAVYEASGADVPDELLSELQECQNALTGAVGGTG